MPHTKAPPSEALLLGLSGGITFGYFSFVYKGLDPHLALLTRNTFNPLETMLDRLGAVRTVKQTTDAARAEANLISALETGRPVLVWADQCSMPYSTYDGTLGEMYMMLPMVVYAYEPRGKAGIADGSRVPLEVRAAELQKARARVKKEKFRIMTLDVPSFDRLKQNVEAALRACVKSFFTSPVKGHSSNFGFAAYQRWADILTNDKDKQSWNKIFPAGRPMYAGLVSAFERIELFGTGGAASRPMFAHFLEEASQLLDRRELRAVARQFAGLEPAWAALCQALLPDEIPAFKESRALMLQKRDLFIEQGAAALPAIREIHRQLDQIRASMQKSFPLKGPAESQFKENLRARILAVYDLEHKAITELERGL